MPTPLKASLQLRLGQQLAITPQLRQAIRLLQLSALELQAEVQQALASNVMLQPDDASTPGNQDAETSSADTVDDHGVQDSDWGEGSNRLDPWSDPANDFLENLSDASGESLQDHLIWQLQLSDLSGRQRKLAEAIIDSLDEDGYLRDPLDELADVAGIDAAAAEAVLQRIQAMDPPGIAARDLRECLLAQLRLMATGPVTELARRLVDQHLDALARGRETLARRLGIATDELDEALELIQSLEPRPGAAIDNRRPDYLVPDVLLTRREDGWRVELNSNVVPRLRLNDEYVRLLKQARERSDDMQAQLQEARWLIRSLSIRNDTLQRVADTIVARQQDYFENGEEAMRPLLLRDVAEAVDLHESTVSRVTSNKYMHTPRGTVPLKYFFSQQLGSSSGGNGPSTIAVRAMIRRLIENENPSQPLSDQKIAARLDDQGIRVARRTVTKYREAMRIPTSYARKSPEPGHTVT